MCEWADVTSGAMRTMKVNQIRREGEKNNASQANEQKRGTFSHNSKGHNYDKWIRNAVMEVKKEILTQEWLLPWRDGHEPSFESAS